MKLQFMLVAFSTLEKNNRNVPIIGILYRLLIFIYFFCLLPHEQICVQSVNFQQLVQIKAPNHHCLYTSPPLNLDSTQSSWSIDCVPSDNRIQEIKSVFVPEPLKQSWSVCQCVCIQPRAASPDGKWLMQVTSFGAGRSWQIAIMPCDWPNYHCPLPCQHICSLFCLNPLLQHFSPTPLFLPLVSSHLLFSLSHPPIL